MPEVWKRCSQCKKDIPLNGVYFVCSVSSCRTKATNYVFCSVACWDAHVPIERHRGDDVAAIERRAPRVPEPEGQTRTAVKRMVVGEPSLAGMTASSGGIAKLGDDEVLVVASKVKKYISEKSGMNTSAGVMDSLTDRVKRICDRAIEEARRNGRKTVLDRDVP